MSLDQANDFLDRIGALPGAKFPTIGTAVKGTVISAEPRQKTEFGTGKPLFYDDGKPRMELVVACTDEAGERFGFYASGQMLAAIKQALAEAGAKLEVGGTLAVQYVADKPSDKGFQPAKQYRAQYKAPAPQAISTGDLI